MALVHPDQVLRLLNGFNPWWSGGGLDLPPVRRVAFKRCIGALLDQEIRRTVVLTGPRRVGKSVILQQIAEELVRRGLPPRSILYATLDHNMLKIAGVQSILEVFHERVWASDEPAYLLLDEVHYAPNWDTELKVLQDHRPQYRILATGSASLTSSVAGSDSGVGRWISIPIPTLSFHEFLAISDRLPSGLPLGLRPMDCLRMTEVDRAALAQKLAPTLPDFASYLLVGGFPETASLTHRIPEAQRLLREDVVDRVLKRDITQLFGTRNIGDLERLFIYLCLHSGSAVNVTRCASELGAHRQTVENHLNVLVQANLLYRLEQAAGGGKKALKGRNKYFLVDAALRNAVLLSGREVLDNPEEAGRIVETAILRHLKAFYYKDLPEVSYWKGSDDTEVDVVLRSPGYVIAAEVKYRSQLREKDFRGIRAFAADNPTAHCYVVTRRAEDFGLLELPTGRAGLRIPAHIFAYLIGQAERAATE